MKPIPLAAFIPPVTGVGAPSAVAANTFDSSGRFPMRPRLGSAKRLRTDGGGDERYSRWDMTRSYPQPIYPGRAVIDVGAVQGLLLGAADAVAAAKALVDGSDCDPKLAVVLNLSIAVYGVVEGIIDKAIVPMNCPAAAGRNDCPPNQAPIPPAQPGKKELEDALETADLTAVVFGADLGGFPLANRDKLAEAFSVGLRSAALKKAEVAGTDMSEAVRVVDDALSCATDMAFLGQVSGPPKQRGGGPENDNRPSNNENEPRNTMPVRLIFPDRWSRIHFESTLREKTGMRQHVTPVQH
jgi:hypothetical protein